MLSSLKPAIRRLLLLKRRRALAGWLGGQSRQCQTDRTEQDWTRKVRRLAERVLRRRRGANGHWDRTTRCLDLGIQYCLRLHLRPASRKLPRERWSSLEATYQLPLRVARSAKSRRRLTWHGQREGTSSNQTSTKGGDVGHETGKSGQAGGQQLDTCPLPFPWLGRVLRFLLLG